MTDTHHVYNRGDSLHGSELTEPLLASDDCSSTVSNSAPIVQFVACIEKDGPSQQITAATTSAAATTISPVPGNIDDVDYVCLPPPERQEGNTQHCQYSLDPKRFAVLAVFSLNGLLASAMWITFAPIEDAVQTFYGGISSSQVNWLSMIFMAAFGPGTALCAWSIPKWGLRATVVVSSAVMAVGSLLRWWSVYWVVHTSDDDDGSGGQGHTSSVAAAYACLLTGQGIVALGQPVFLNAPARVASAWFKQTTQAIAVAVFCSLMGMVLGQSMSPLLVSEATGAHLDQLLAGQALAAVSCALLTWWCFASEPDEPPSAAEAAKRRPTDSSSPSSFRKDIWKLLMDPQYAKMLVAFGLGYGVNNAILTLLQPWVASMGFPGDETAGLCGSLLIAGGVVGTVIAAPLLDRSQNYNQAIRWSFPVAFLVAVLAVAKFQPSSPVWLLATSFTAMGMTQLPLLTICLDAAAAHSYPIPEELSSAGLQLVGQYLGIVIIDGMGSLLPTTDGQHNDSPKGFAAPINIAFLVLLGISALASLLYRGDDPRRLANETVSSTPATLSDGTETATNGLSVRDDVVESVSIAEEVP